MLERALDGALEKACRGDVQLVAEARAEFRRGLRIVVTPGQEPKAIGTGR